MSWALTSWTTRLLTQFSEALMLVEETRTSEASRGRSRLKRGFQFLQHGKWYQAIDQLAKAQALLAKEEHHDSYVASIFLTGLAYRDAGLLSAVRGEYGSGYLNCYAEQT